MVRSWGETFLMTTAAITNTTYTLYLRPGNSSQSLSEQNRNLPWNVFDTVNMHILLISYMRTTCQYQQRA